MRFEISNEKLDTNGFVPMRKCVGYFGHNDHDIEDCPYRDCDRHKEISAVYKDLGLIDDVTELPQEQQEKLLGIVYRNTNNDLQRDFMKAGMRTAKHIIGSDGKNCAYVAIRGSTSRGAAREDEDVDLFVIGENPKKLKQYLEEISLEEGKRLKQKHPETKRSEKILIVPIVIGDDYLEDFIHDPFTIDRDPRFFDPLSKTKMERVMKMQNVIYRFFGNEQILDDPMNDPFEFARRAISPGRRIFGLSEKERTHHMIALLTRLYGVQIHGDVPQFNITRLRDAYLFEEFKDFL